jgi:hypothetical protein
MNARAMSLIAVVACGKPDGSPTTATQAPLVMPEASAVAEGAQMAAGMGASASAVAPASPPAAPQTVVAQHILCAYRGAKRAPPGVTRTKDAARARAAQALAKVRDGVPFEEVVKSFSDDAGSVDRMGSVGKFRREDMDPSFSAAAFALKAGGVSDVVETPFGFHVIKRTQ